MATLNSNGYCDKHQALSVGWVATQKGLTSSQRGYGAQWRKIRKVIIARDKGLCVPCYKLGYVTPFFAVDHVVPKAEGGTDSPDNLQCICRQCHNDKTIIEAERARKFNAGQGGG